jgi:hypothetical protein
MTATITIKHNDAITILTDGLGFRQDGTSCELCKCALLAGAPALIAGRGIGKLVWTLAADASDLSFDGIVSNGGEIVRKQVDRIAADSRPEDLASTELYLAGYSEKQKRLVLYFLTVGERYASRGWQPFTWIETPDAYTAAPLPDLAAAGFRLPAPEDFDPAAHGVVLMNLQRETPDAGHLIGKYIQASTVTKDGVSAKIVYRWPESARG